MTDALIQDLLATSVSRYPDRPAIVCQKETITYADLDLKATLLAQALIDAGVTPGQPVGISMHRCSEAIVGLHGILRASPGVNALNFSSAQAIAMDVRL